MPHCSISKPLERPMTLLDWLLAAQALALVPTWVAATPAAATTATTATLPALKLSGDAVTVSGLSSGGHAAGQCQVAFSGPLWDAVGLAAGPAGCSRSQLMHGNARMRQPSRRGALADAVPGLDRHRLPGAVSVRAGSARRQRADAQARLP
jgi:hypothetical protein